MIIRNKEEYQKCQKLNIHITSDKEICTGIARQMGLPSETELKKVASDRESIFAVIGDGAAIDDQYILVAMAVIENEIFYQAVTCFDIKATGLMAYCYLQEKKERICEDTVEMGGGVERAGNLKEFLERVPA